MQALPQEALAAVESMRQGITRLTGEIAALDKQRKAKKDELKRYEKSLALLTGEKPERKKRGAGAKAAGKEAA